MILANGKLYDSRQQESILSGLERRVLQTLAGPPLSSEAVIAAIDRLGRRLDRGAFAPLLAQIEQADRYLSQIRPLITREALEYKIQAELGSDAVPCCTAPPDGLPALTVHPAPLGVLLHIAAGKMDGLPAYSVVEGLLTGNINILRCAEIRPSRRKADRVGTSPQLCLSFRPPGPAAGLARSGPAYR